MPIDAVPDPSHVAFDGWMARNLARADKNRKARATAPGMHGEQPPVMHNACEFEMGYIMARARKFKKDNNDDVADNDIDHSYVKKVKAGKVI